MWLWKWFWNCGRLKKKQPGLLDGSRLPGEGERVLADPEARALPQMQPTEARREFFYILILLLKNFRQDESEPEESDAEEWTHHSRGVKQQVWDDIIAFHNYLFNKLDPNPDFGIPKSKSNFLPKKQTRIGKDGQKSLNHLKTITIIMNCCKSPSNAAIWVSN